VKYAIVTFGCRVNQADSIDIERQLLAQGGRPVDAEEAELAVTGRYFETGEKLVGLREMLERGWK